MIAWRKMMIAAVAPLMLSGCLWGPGKFNSELALRRNGTFVLDYRGEILLQMPDKDAVPAPWANSMAKCYTDGRAEFSSEVPVMVMTEGPASGSEDAEEKPCSAAQIAKLKAEYEKKAAEQAAKKRKENDEMAKLFGIPGSDDESNRRFAANLMKHQGWRSVHYKGQGVFQVDYHFEGRLNQDFAFPLMPDSDLLIPFIMIRPRMDGSVKVSAPALVGGSGVFAARAKAMNLPNSKDGPPSHAEGRFTIVTDGEILTNNSEDGPAAHPAGRQVHWDVGPGSDKVPEMLVRF